MKYRIVEFRPGRYRAQRRVMRVWLRTISCTFVSIEDAEKSIVLYKAQQEARKRDRAHRPKVVKEL
jgi:hypothetical protein